MKKTKTFVEFLEHLNKKNKNKQIIKIGNEKYIQKYTHILYNPELIHIDIDEEMEDIFFYNNIKTYIETTKTTVSFKECYKTIAPLMFDFKLKIKKKTTEDEIKNIIKFLNAQILPKYFDTTNEQLITIILYSMNEFMDGGHLSYYFSIFYPNAFVNIDMRYILRNELINFIEQNKMFEDYDPKDYLFIDAMYEYGKLLYGCSDENNQMMVIKNIFDYKCCNYMIDFNKLNMQQYLSIRKYNKHYNVLNCKFPKADIMNKYLNIESELIQKKIYKAKYINVETNEDNNLCAIKLMKIIKQCRGEHYLNWLRIGWVLHNIDYYKLFKVWFEYTIKIKPSFKCDIDTCKIIWNNFTDEGYTLASLYFWAKQDNYNEYLKFRDERIRNLMVPIAYAPDATSKIAKILIEMFKYEYVCASTKVNDAWYQFKNHRWVHIDNGNTLYTKISEDLYREFGKHCRNIEIDAEEEDNENEKKANDIVEKLRKIRNNLLRTTVKKNIMEEAKYIAYNDKFLEKLNEKRHLLGVNNGVIDLELCELRDGCPDDYITFSTHVNYIPYKKYDIHTKEMNNFFKQIMPEDNMRTFLKMYLSTFISGDVNEEKLPIFTGGGGNGKSKLIELLKNTLGDYMKPMDIRVLTQKRGNAGQASSEVADKKGVRACPSEEPEKEAKLQIGFMKNMTGGDQLPARELYKNNIYFKPQFKLFIICNDIPEIPTLDGGTWRRIWIIPFESSFVEEPDENDKTQFKLDTQLSKKMDNWKESLLSMLVEYYKLYKQHGLKPPEKVVKFTKEHQKRNDILMEFIDDHIMETGKETDKVNINNLLTLMKFWYKQQYGDKNPPPGKDVKQYFDKCKKYKKLYDPNSSILKCYKLKEPEIDE